MLPCQQNALKRPNKKTSFVISDISLFKQLIHIIK